MSKRASAGCSGLGNNDTHLYIISVGLEVISCIYYLTKTSVLVYIGAVQTAADHYSVYFSGFYILVLVIILYYFLLHISSIGKLLLHTLHRELNTIFNEHSILFKVMHFLVLCSIQVYSFESNTFTE